ncbi:MAG TPA: protein kinase [Trebonia sp.]|nr:protein kinase [Trebonia sp.]
MSDYVLDGRYELLDRIASGGMGEVWLGIDRQLDRQVAIKLLHATHAGDEQFRARFRAEARYAGSLSHPGITQIYSYGEHSPLGGPYLVMEFVAGEPLSAILERVGRLPPETVLDIVSQTARALDVAHHSGIVHRDIKPGNLLIMADGTTKITDFGIAKAREWGDPQLTATGIVMGTAMYVSPEQATGSTVTGSSDIYSLGVVAYECLAGQPPFVAEQPLAIAIMHKHDPVPPLPPDVPWQVGDLVMSMLAKTPDGRPESARHLADRADIIRDARAQSGAGYATTAALPVVPDFPASDYPTATYSAAEYPFSDYPTRYEDQYQNTRYQGHHPERSVVSLFTRHPLATAGMGVALCGIGAIVAVLLTSGTGPQKTPSDPPAPRVSASTTRHPKTHTRTSQAAPSAPSTNVYTTPVTAPAQQPTQQYQPSVSPSPTTQAPTTAPPPSTPTSPTASASSSTPTPTPTASLPTIFPPPPTSSSPAPSHQG